MRQIAFVLLLAVCSIVSACKEKTSKPVEPTAALKPAGQKITVCLLPKKKGLPYFSSCADGARQAAEELGNIELIYDGPTDGSPEKAASMIDRWTFKKVDVIAVSPNDPNVLASAMKQA